MSALGQKQTSDWRPLMSALPPKADIAGMRGCPLSARSRHKSRLDDLGFCCVLLPRIAQ
jgi:hypothetical protein